MSYNLKKEPDFIVPVFQHTRTIKDREIDMEYNKLSYHARQQLFPELPAMPESEHWELRQFEHFKLTGILLPNFRWNAVLLIQKYLEHQFFYVVVQTYPDGAHFHDETNLEIPGSGYFELTPTNTSELRDGQVLIRNVVRHRIATIAGVVCAETSKTMGSSLVLKSYLANHCVPHVDFTIGLRISEGSSSKPFVNSFTSYRYGIEPRGAQLYTPAQFEMIFENEAWSMPTYETTYSRVTGNGVGLASPKWENVWSSVLAAY